MVESQDIDQDLKELNQIYTELSKDARTIATDLSESITAYYLLGFYLLAFSFGTDFYILLSKSITFDIGFIVIWAVFVNLIPIVSGCIILWRHHKLNARYKTLFRLEKSLRIKESKNSAEKERL